MTALSERVKKAKALNFVAIPGVTEGKAYGTTGSNGDRYQVRLVSEKSTTFELMTGWKETALNFRVTCNKIDGSQANGYKACPGNSHNHTVCYHCLGAIHHSLKEAGLNIRFYQTMKEAVTLKMGGTVAQIQSSQGNKGRVFAVISRQDPPAYQKNADLIRGKKEEEVID